MRICWAEKGDIKTLTDFWYAMTCEMEEKDGIPRPSMGRVHEVYHFFLKEYEKKNLVFRIAKNNSGQIVACSGGLLRSEYAYPLAEKQTLYGWIVNVYTKKEYRRNGLASQLTADVCEWLKTNGAKRARLWTSSQARRVYERLGFSQSHEMEKQL